MSILAIKIALKIGDKAATMLRGGRFFCVKCMSNQWKQFKPIYTTLTQVSLTFTTKKARWELSSLHEARTKILVL